ncbi:PE domain-containing protein [Tsukamurella pseudospumae]|uniref:PE domain-containing protein n=1 Tax=Tsukamurella pseudospumae TaxID=239498 RepID=A0A137ZAA2_9ACTN|nr:PE domain-containing protein [Tsukamurella pseudospumae]KXO95091.1 hypothetical protein AXK61_23770 [Tsukamurella pseudospumae]
MPAQLVSGTSEVVTNVVASSGVVAGTAAALGSSEPAGADEVSLLASTSSTVHAANFLSTSVVEHAVVAQYGVSLAGVAATYVIADNAVTF